MKTHQGSVNDYATSVIVNNNGGYFVGGYSGSYDGDIQSNYGLNDCWIIRIDYEGTILWSGNYGGTNSDYAYCIQETNDGNIIIGGQTSSNNIDVSGNNGSVDFWILKIDVLGGIIWSRTIGGSGEDFMSSLAESDDGGYYAIGFSTSNDGDVIGNNGNQDILVAKVDSMGDLLWTSCIGGIGTDNGIGVTSSNYGNCVIAGFSWSDDGDIADNNGGYDFWLSELCSGYLIEDEDSICIGDSLFWNGDYYSLFGIYFDTLTASGGCDSIISLYLSQVYVDNSVTQVLNILTANSIDSIYQWIDCTNGNIPLIGEANQSFIATVNGDYAVIITGNGCADTSSCYTVSNLDIAESDIFNRILIYPNPVTDKLVIDGLLFADNVKLFDVFGREYINLIIDKDPFLIYLSEYSQGVYFLRVERNNQIRVFKVIKH